MVRHHGERRDDPKRRASARRRPEQVRVLRVGRGEDGAVRSDDFERLDLVGEQTPSARRQPEPALASVTARADVRACPMRHCALACQEYRIVELEFRPPSPYRCRRSEHGD